MSERQTPPVKPATFLVSLAERIAPWKPAIAAVLSLCFAGLGHLFLRAWLRGLAFFLPNYFLFTISDYWPNGILINIVCFIFSAVDAYSIAKNGRGIF